MNHLHILFAPLLPIQLIEALALVTSLLIAYALTHRARGSILRALSFALILATLANPTLQEEQRTPLKDIALVVVDDSASMTLQDRATQTATALQKITEKLSAFQDLNTEILHVKGTDETDLFTSIEQKLTTIPRDRLAGIIALTDGQINDKPTAPFTAPFHALIAGHKNEIDRRLTITQAPTYGIVGKTVTLTLRIDDQPKPQSETAPLRFRSGTTDTTTTIPVGQDVPFQVPITQAGQNLTVFSTDTLPNELTPLNNTTSTRINGIRDRLRVLLVSGQPHSGGRSWRNLLKSDPAVDLVHFTILRSPLKQDATPNTELSLIAFPVQELFETKLKSFDLVIFDRFRPQSLVPDSYLANIATYVENGGSLLISNATDEGTPPLAQSPLARILPTEPTGKLLTGAFVPTLTETGERHPVTYSLAKNFPQNSWGKWFRQTEARATKGDVLMTGLNNQPLLVLDHVGQGRVAQFLSDQFWLWSRSQEGGGPQAELLRRTTHWLVQEPELDETALRATTETTDQGQTLTLTKQTLHDTTTTVTVTDPQDKTTDITLNTSPNKALLTATIPAPHSGLYRLKENTPNSKEILVMAGATNTPETTDMQATETKLAPYGSIHWLETTTPNIHRTNANAPQTGSTWIGLKKNEQFQITGSQSHPLLPPWLTITLLLVLIMFAWRKEGSNKKGS